MIPKTKPSYRSTVKPPRKQVAKKNAMCVDCGELFYGIISGAKIENSHPWKRLSECARIILNQQGTSSSLLMVPKLLCLKRVYIYFNDLQCWKYIKNIDLIGTMMLNHRDLGVPNLQTDPNHLMYIVGYIYRMKLH